MTVSEQEVMRAPAVPPSPSGPPIPLRMRLRTRQVQFCSRWIRILTGIPFLALLMRRTRETPPIRQALAAMTGYNRPFATLREAEAFIADHDGGGHSHPFCAINLMHRVARAEPSDYPAMFFLQPLVPTVRTIFDFGGSVGNLFYCYSRYLKLPSDLRWTVFDVAENVELGSQIAAEAGEHRLNFTTSLREGEGADVFIATGAAHYFEKQLGDILAEFQHKPRYVLVNRTPLTDGPPFATVQDAGRYRVACILHHHAEFIRRFELAGYELVDEWRAVERSLLIPAYPDRSVGAYSGMFFRLREGNVRGRTP